MKNILVFLLLILPLHTWASILLEPLVGYSDGKLVLDEDIDMNGMTYGGRVGFTGDNFQIAYSYQKTDFTVDDADEKFKTSEGGIFFGLKAWHIRLFAEYMIGAKADIGDSKWEGGDGLKFGLNFYLFKHLTVEASWREVDYDEIDGLTDLDYGYKAFFIGLSFPFRLF